MWGVCLSLRFGQDKSVSCVSSCLSMALKAYVSLLKLSLKHDSLFVVEIYCYVLNFRVASNLR